MNEKIIELLYRSFDDRLNDEEQMQLDDALAASPDLQAEKERVEALRQELEASKTESFKPFFAERVMNKIDTLKESETGLEQLFESLQYFFRRVAVAAAVVVVLLVAYNLKTSDEISLSAAIGVSETGLEEVLETPIESMLEQLS